MKIIYDNIAFSNQKIGGISVVWFELLKRIVLDKRFSVLFIEYTGSERNVLRKNLKIPKENILHRNIFFPKIKRYLNPNISSKDKFLFHSSYYRTSNNPNAINITTVHDFTYEYFSNGIKRFIHSWQKNRAIKKSDYIICISENTKKDLLRFVKGIDTKKIRIIYNGVSDEYFSIKDSYSNELPFEKNSYVLFVGARSGYKNFSFAVDVMSQSDLNFVIVGSELSKKELVFLNAKIDPSRYKIFTHISNNNLNIIYNNAFCLLYPSKYEGFGIPILEAQKAGCPVIAYNSSSIPEIIGDITLIFNDFTVGTILKLFNLIENSDKRKLIINDGIINASRFSWDEMYKNVLALYLEAFNQ